MDKRNELLHYGSDDVIGISVAKELIPTKANLDGVNLCNYKILNPGEFVYLADTSRRGDKIAIAFNDSSNAYIASSINMVFKLNEKAADFLDATYLRMYFNRPEFDRYARFHSWGSARETFSWDELCNIELDLPPLAIQKSFSTIYAELQFRLSRYNREVEDLNLAIAGTLDNCKKTENRTRLGDLLIPIDRRNDKGLDSESRGISLDHLFIPSRDRISNPKNYKVVLPGEIACNLIHVGRDKAFPIAQNYGIEPILVSPDYHVFRAVDSTIASYLMAWFSRPEVGRFGWYICDADIRGRLNISSFLSLYVPLPTRSQLNAISMLQTARDKIAISASTLANLLQNICPVLIKGSIDEAQREG